MVLSERKHHHEDLTLIRSKTYSMNAGPGRGSIIGAIKGNHGAEAARDSGEFVRGGAGRGGEGREAFAGRGE